MIGGSCQPPVNHSRTCMTMIMFVHHMSWPDDERRAVSTSENRAESRVTPIKENGGQCEMKEKMGQRENGADRKRWKRGKK